MLYLASKTLYLNLRRPEQIHRNQNPPSSKVNKLRANYTNLPCRSHYRDQTTITKVNKKLNTFHEAGLQVPSLNSLHENRIVAAGEAT